MIIWSGFNYYGVRGLPLTIDEKRFIFWGGGKNCKSVYLEFLLGKNNTSHIPLQLLSNDEFVSVNLDGKLTHIFPDLEKHELYPTGTIKVFSGVIDLHCA